MEAITNRTPQQEQELQNKKKELQDLENKQDGGNKKPTNFVPWIIGGGIVVILVIGLFAYFWWKRNKQ